MKSTCFIIPLHVYPFDVLFSIGETDEQFRKSIRKYCPPSVINDLGEDPLILKFTETSKGRTVHLNSTNQTFIRLKHYPKTCSDYGDIAHEIFHAVEFIFHKIGLHHSVESGEAYAYLVGYLTKEIYKRLQ